MTDAGIRFPVRSRKTLPAINQKSPSMDKHTKRENLLFLPLLVRFNVLSHNIIDDVAQNGFLQAGYLF